MGDAAIGRDEEGKIILGRDYGGGAGPSSVFHIPDEPFRVQEIRHLTDATFVMKIDRHDMPFRPGQCMSVGLKNSGVNREYSLYSGIDDPYIEILIREVPSGAVSPRLKRCETGAMLDVLGPYSEFVLTKPHDKSRRYLFIGTGTGIAPYRSFVRSYDLDYKIIHGVSYANERYDHSEYPSERYVACVNREVAEGCFHGRVTEYLSRESIDPTLFCYLCGNRKMLDEVFELLRSKGVPSTQIITEVFF